MRIAARSLAGLAAGPLLILLAQPGPASGQAPCMPGSTVSVVAVSADGTVSRGTLFWAQAPAGARLAAAVTVFDSTDAMIHGIRAAWQEDGVSPAGALVRLEMDRAQFALSGRKKVQVSWRDEQGMPRSTCASIRLQAPAPDSMTVRWLLPTGLADALDGSGAVGNADRPRLRLTGVGFWADMLLEVDPMLAHSLDLSGPLSITAGTPNDVADMDVKLLAPTLPAGRFSATLADEGWSRRTVRVPPLTIVGPVPTLAQPNTVTHEYYLPADVARAELVLAGSNFAPPLVAEVTALAADGTRQLVQTFTIAGPPEQCAPTDNLQCVRLSFDHFGRGGAGAYAIRVKNFDGRWSPEPVVARVRSDVFAITRVETGLSDPTAAIVSVPTQIRLFVPAEKQLPVASAPPVVRFNGTGLALRVLPQPDGTILVPDVRVDDPGGDTDPFTVAVSLEYAGGAIGQGALRVLRRTQLSGPLIIYGEAGQTVRVPGRYLEGAEVGSGATTTVSGTRLDGNSLLLSLSNPTRGAGQDTLPVLRAGTRVGALPVEIRRRPALTSAVAVSVGSEGAGDGACPSPADGDTFGRDLVAGPDAVICVQVRPGAADLNPAVMDSITVTVLQDGKLIGAVKSAGFPARSGSRPIALPLVGIEDGQPVTIHVERANGEAVDGQVRTRVRERFGPFASITAVSIQLGLSRAQQAVEERRLSQVFNPQVGAWVNPISTRKDLRLFGSVLTLRRSYCGSTIQDVPAWSVGVLLRSLLTIGVGHAIGSVQLPAGCSGDEAGAADQGVPNRDSGRFFLVIGGGIVVGR